MRIIQRPQKWKKSELERVVDGRVVETAQLARAIRETGERLGLIGGDCYARNVPPVGDLFHEHLVIHFCLEVPPRLRLHRENCMRMVRSFLATATQVEADCDE